MAQSSLITVSVYWGLGRHMSYLNNKKIVNARKFLILCQAWGIAAPTLGRMSFCFYLLQFVYTYSIARNLLYFFIGSQSIINLLTIVLIYVQCGARVEALWDNSVDATCWNIFVQRDMGFFQSGKSLGRGLLFLLTQS
jgi:hypothetical protein